MVSSCSAHGCTNRRTPGSTIHFFSFPLKNPARNQLWIQAVARKGFVPNKYSKLCSEHFDPSCFYDPPGGSYKVRLNDNAVPTVFPTSFSLANKRLSKSRNVDFETIVCSTDELVLQSTTTSEEEEKCVENSDAPLLNDQYILYSITPLAQSSLPDTIIREKEKCIEVDENSEVPLLSDQYVLYSITPSTQLSLSDTSKREKEKLIQADNSSKVQILSTPSKSKKTRYVFSSPKTKLNRRSPSKYDLKNIIRNLSRENRTLKQEIRRKNITISSIKDELNELKVKQILYTDYEISL